MSDPYIAEIKIFSGHFAPRGWAFCDGQLLFISSNEALFSIIGTTYGGDGHSKFALPDLRGRAPMHPGHGSGLTFRTLGEKTGDTAVTLTHENLPPHTHTVYAPAPGSGSYEPSFQGNSLPSFYGLYTNETRAVGHMSHEVVSSEGNSRPHENVQPYIVLNFIIALAGVYPVKTMNS